MACCRFVEASSQQINTHVYPDWPASQPCDPPLPTHTHTQLVLCAPTNSTQHETRRPPLPHLHRLDIPLLSRTLRGQPRRSVSPVRTFRRLYLFSHSTQASRVKTAPSESTSRGTPRASGAPMASSRTRRLRGLRMLGLRKTLRMVTPRCRLIRRRSSVCPAP